MTPGIFLYLQGSARLTHHLRHLPRSRGVSALLDLEASVDNQHGQVHQFLGWWSPHSPPHKEAGMHQPVDIREVKTYL